MSDVSETSPSNEASAETPTPVLGDFPNEDVLDDAVDAFADVLELKVKLLRRYIPKPKLQTNSELTGTYIEEIVRTFIAEWLGERHLLHGTLYSMADKSGKGFEERAWEMVGTKTNREKLVDKLTHKSYQLDGIIHEPRLGPCVLRERDFAVIHPAFCSGILEIKTTYDVRDLRLRLQNIYIRYFKGIRLSSSVMGIIINHKDPESTSRIDHSLYIHDYAVATLGEPWCPIFIMGEESEEGFEPYKPAIRSLISAILHLPRITTTYTAEASRIPSSVEPPAASSSPPEDGAQL